MAEKKALLVGGSGALGTYLIPALLKMDFKVDVLCLEDIISNDPNLRYMNVDAKDVDVITEILKNEYNVVVDFMLYFSAEEFSKYYKLYLDNTDHYVFLSTYRIYADSFPITEESPRLLDVSTDQAFLNSGDYSIYKAQEEDMLRNSGYSNWTILRPAITYSKARFQLTILEMPVIIYRMLRGKTVVLPEQALDVQGTLSWAGDFATMVSRLILNPQAMKETYTVSTSEHHTWREIAEIYGEIGGLKYVGADTEDFLNIVNPGNIHTRQQLTHDRFFNRVVDNTKILNHTGMKQSELMPLKQGLRMEFFGVPRLGKWEDYGMNARMDEYLEKHNIK